MTADPLSYFSRGLVNIRVLEVELKYEHICNASEIARLGEQVIIVALTGLEKLGITITLLGEETRDKIAMSAVGAAWKMDRELVFREIILSKLQNLPTEHMLRLLSNRRRALRLGLTLALPELSESLSRSMQSKGLFG